MTDYEYFESIGKWAEDHSGEIEKLAKKDKEAQLFIMFHRMVFRRPNRTTWEMLAGAYELIKDRI